MEYNELIKNEIYTHLNGNIVRYENLNSLNKVCGIHIGGFKSDLYYNNGNFNIKELKLATSEEKHWLNSCITADKFITFEEAMKTFIPEYVECIKSATNAFVKNKVYKVKNKNYYKTFNLFDTDNVERNVIMNGGLWQFKPSTKEAYDVQFVVKEPEFVLPEKWCIKFSKDIELLNWCKKNTQTDFKSFENLFVTEDNYFHYPLNAIQVTKRNNDYTEITLEQFKKYVLKEETIEEVIEPLPQFKVIETIETITKVENNEGNQFFIGDVVKSSNGTVQTIESFDYNTKKTNIIAFTNKQSILGNGIGIDKIEHYIEPKTDYKILEYKTEGGISCKAPFLADSHQFYINERCKIYSIKRISDDLIITVGDEVLSKTCGVPNKILSIELINNKIRLYPRNSFYNLEDIIKVKEETLLEKAKRLYSIGTKYKCAYSDKQFTVILQNFSEISNTEIYGENSKGCLLYGDKWAEIIE